jgi:hypothetical protein
MVILVNLLNKDNHNHLCIKYLHGMIIKHQKNINHLYPSIVPIVNPVSKIKTFLENKTNSIKNNHLKILLTLLINYRKNKIMSKISLDNLPKSIIIPNTIKIH